MGSLGRDALSSSVGPSWCRPSVGRRDVLTNRSVEVVRSSSVVLSA